MKSTNPNESNFAKQLQDAKFAMFAERNLPKENENRIKLAEWHKKEYARLMSLHIELL